MAMISATYQLPADDSDVLGNAQSNMKNAPENGLMQVWAGSDQADGQLTIKHKGEEVVETSEMRVITANALPLNGPPDFEFGVEENKPTIINYNEVTGATAMLHVKFFTLGEVLLGLARR